MTASRGWKVCDIDGMKLFLTADFDPKETSSHALLAELLDMEQEELERRLVYGPHGKPELPDGPAFSVSHSGRYWAVLIAYDESAGGKPSVGLDIQVSVPASYESIAKRFFREEEAALVMAASDEEARREVFFRLWTKREALLKAAGESVFRRAEPLTDVEVKEIALTEGLYAASAVKRMK